MTGGSLTSSDPGKEPPSAPRIWNDVLVSPEKRVAALVAEMTLREKVAQLYGVWVGASSDGGDVSPFQHDLDEAVDLDSILQYGLGQLTRPFGSAPVDAGVGLISLARSQRRIVEASRFGIPALVHEECLSGFTAWGATAYPVPLAWGATFAPELIERMGARIGRSMRSVGVHQGLAPVLDVARDLRWGRVEETIGEDPYLVGTTATAYVRGLESAGIIATLKHFVGYSASRAGRNLAPVSMGPREMEDVMLPPFEMAVRDSGVRSIMHSYTDTDGLPNAANESLLTGLLRDRWGFTGTVVADYAGIKFLHTLHRVALDEGDAAAQALRAGVDVELPTIDTFGPPLIAEVESGRLDESFVDRALTRVLRQKVELGLLDPGWSALSAGWSESDLDDAEAARGRVSLDVGADRALAREIAERSIVLLGNDGTLPVDPVGARSPRRIAVIGPSADDAMVLVGCYAFPNHVLALHPAVPLGIDIPTVADAIRSEFPDADVSVVGGVSISGDDESAIPAALTAARAADLTIVVLGDRAGLFGRGTSGEGCDAADLELPGRQWPLLDALLDTGTPVIVTLITGRPYTLHDAPGRAAGILQAFFPGEEGSTAIAGVISGRVSPSGRLPVSIPSHAGAQPSTYLASRLAQVNPTSTIDPTPAFPFGYGSSYTTFDWHEATLDDQPLDQRHHPIPTDGLATVGVSVTNSGERPGIEVVQLYLHDPVASVTQPESRLIGYSAVALSPGETVRVSFRVPADLAAFTGRDLQRIVEPGEIVLRLAASSADTRFNVPISLVGPARTVDHTRALTSQASVHR